MLRTALFFAILFFTTTVAAQDTLRPGNVVGGSVSDSDTVSYVIDVAAEHFIMGEVRDLTGNAILQLLDPEGRPIAGTTYPLAFAFETSEAGRYLLQVFAEDDGVGGFEVFLDKIEPIETNPAKLVEQLMFPYDRDDSPGAAVSVWQNGRTFFRVHMGWLTWPMGSRLISIPPQTSVHIEAIHSFCHHVAGRTWKTLTRR